MSNALDLYDLAYRLTSDMNRVKARATEPLLVSFLYRAAPIRTMHSIHSYARK